RVDGVGIGGLREPEDVLDLGNAGTGARLLMGLLAGHPLTAFLTGDASLRRRPMAGAAEPLPIEYRLPVPSAQVKSAVLLAGLAASGVTSVVETQPTRDHSERML